MKRDMGDLPFSLREFKVFLLKKTEFRKMFVTYRKNMFDKRYAPSIDRIDDYKPYTFDNIRVITWEENDAKGKADRLNGVNNKVSKAVRCIVGNGVEIRFASISNASRVSGISITRLRKIIEKGKTYEGKRWIYDEG